MSILSRVLIAAWLLVGSGSTLANTKTTVFKNVELIDGTGGGVTHDVCISVAGGRIREVSACLDFEIPSNAHVIELKGHYLLPGFIDTHVHAAWGPLDADLSGPAPIISLSYDEGISQQILKALPAYGITSIRNPAAPTIEGVALRDAVAEGLIFGPEIVTAGAAIDQIVFPGLVDTAQTEDQITAVVKQQVAAGVDIIKLYAALTPNLIGAATKTAKELGVPTVGHLFLTDWRQATELGIDGIVHAMPSSSTLLPPSKQAEYLGGITGTQFLYQWYEYVDFKSPEINAAITAMAESGVNHDPTLVAVEGMFFGNQPSVTENPKLAALPARVRADWNGPAGLTTAWNTSDFNRAQAVWPQVLALVKLMHDAGVMLTAGTDTVNPNVAPGDGFHRELELLVSAGISPAQVIRIATLNGATAIGKQDELGSIAPGKRANLVILSENPLLDIRNSRTITRVYKDGDLFSAPRKLADEEG